MKNYNTAIERIKKDFTDDDWDRFNQLSGYLFTINELECMWKNEHDWVMVEDIEDAAHLRKLMDDGYTPIPF